MSELVKCPRCGKLVKSEDYSSHKCNSNPPKPDKSIKGVIINTRD